MNLSLLDPFQNDFPEVIEEYLDDRPSRCVAFNRRGTLLAAGCFDGSCVIWDFETRGVAKVLSDPAAATAPITSVSWSKCGYKLLAAACTQNRIIMWDVASAKVDSVLDFANRVVSARVNPCCLSLCIVSPMGSPPLVVDLRQPQKQTTLPVSGPSPSRTMPPPAASARGKPRPRRGKGSAATPSFAVLAGSGTGSGSSSLSAPCLFHRNGEIAVVGTATGSILLVRCCQISRTSKEKAGVVLSAPTAILCIQVGGGQCVKDLALSRDCNFLLANCADRVLRVFDLKLCKKGEGVGKGAGTYPNSTAVAAGKDCSAVPPQTDGAVAEEPSRSASRGNENQHLKEQEECLPRRSACEAVHGDAPKQGNGVGDHSLEIPPVSGEYDATLRLAKEFQDAVNRVHWRSACFSGDGEFVMAGSAARGEHRIHIWSREFGQLVRILEGPSQRESVSVLEVMWHPIQKLAVSIAASGTVYIWAQDYMESWSAFAPDFKELEENEEYVEREDEFDSNPREQPQEVEGASGRALGVEEEEVEVDIEELERVAAYSDSDNSEDGLLFLPGHPEADAEHMVTGPVAEDDNKASGLEEAQPAAGCLKGKHELPDEEISAGKRMKLLKSETAAMRQHKVTHSS